MSETKIKKQKQNEVELTVNKNHMEINGNGETETENEPTTFAQKIRSFFNFFTVEPFLLCYILPNVFSAIAIQKLNMEKACLADLNFTEDICSKIVEGDASDNITSDALDAAQKLVADMTAWRQPLQSGLPAIVILFVGAWSDRTGNRKALMLIPIIGEIISSVGLLLTTYYFLDWPLWVTGLIEGLPPALTGGISIALLGSYSYIADVTSTDSRTFRVGLVAVIVVLGFPIASAISGVLTEGVGYYGVFSIGMAMYIIGFIHTYFRIHDVRKTEMEGTFSQKFIEFFHPRNVWDTISLVVLSRGRQFIQILLIICAHIVIMGPVFGEGPLIYLYTLKKFNMDPVDYSIFTTYSLIMGLSGTTIAVTIFSKLLKWHDAVLGIIATSCKVVGNFVYALAPTRGWFYAGPAFDFFGSCGVTAIRSLGTKIVKPDEVGKICSLIGLVEAIIPVIYTPIYSKLYSFTIESFPGAFYLLGGVMTIPAFFIFISLYILYKKQERDVVKDPGAKEMHAHENAITAL